MRHELTGTARPYCRAGVEHRNVWQLTVNLPTERYTDADGQTRRRYPKTTKTVQASGIRAAEKALAKWIAELERERARDGSRLTVGELLTRWMRAITASGEIRPATAAFYRQQVELHLEPAIGMIGAQALQPSDLSRMYADKRRSGLAETTLHHLHATGRAAYAWAIREEIVERSPFARVKNPPRQAQRELTVWSQETILAALELSAGDPNARNMRDQSPILIHVPLVLAAWSGLRAGEVCGLRWSDLDLEHGLAVIERTIEAVDGELHVVPPKSRAGARVVELPRQAIEILEQHKRRQDEHRIGRRGRLNPLGYVICTRGGGIVTPSSISSAWNRFVKTRKLPEISFHGLRHSYATDLFAQAPDGGESMLKIVQERLGHADPATTARIYLHTTEQARTAARIGQERRIAEAAARRAEAARDSRTSRERVVSLDERRREK